MTLERRSICDDDKLIVRYGLHNRVDVGSLTRAFEI